VIEGSLTVRVAGKEQCLGGRKIALECHDEGTASGAKIRGDRDVRFLQEGPARTTLEAEIAGNCSASLGLSAVGARLRAVAKSAVITSLLSQHLPGLTAT